MRKILILALSFSLILTACGRTTTFVRAGTPVKLAKEVKTKAYVPDSNGKEVLADVVLLPGMVCGFPPSKIALPAGPVTKGSMPVIEK